MLKSNKSINANEVRPEDFAKTGVAMIYLKISGAGVMQVKTTLACFKELSVAHTRYFQWAEMCAEDREANPIPVIFHFTDKGINVVTVCLWEIVGLQWAYFEMEY